MEEAAGQMGMAGIQRVEDASLVVGRRTLYLSILNQIPDTEGRGSLEWIGRTDLTLSRFPRDL